MINASRQLISFESQIYKSQLIVNLFEYIGCPNRLSYVRLHYNTQFNHIICAPISTFRNDITCELNSLTCTII